MENNTKVEAATSVQDELGFTTKDIFEQIKALQNELAEKHSLFRLDDALLAVFANTEFEDDQAKSDAVANITSVFAAREESLRYLLSMYKELLNLIIFNLK